MSFKYALGGKLFRGRVDLANAAEATEDIAPRGGGGPLGPNDYSVAGLPLAQAVDTVTIDTAADLETYTVTIRRQTFTITSDGTATVTEIRDALNVLIDAAIAAGLTVARVDNGVDAMDITADVPGEALDTTVTAETPVNISLAGSLNTAAGNVGIVAKKSGQIVVRANAAMTASFDLLIVG